MFYKVFQFFRFLAVPELKNNIMFKRIVDFFPFRIRAFLIILFEIMNRLSTLLICTSSYWYRKKFNVEKSNKEFNLLQTTVCSRSEIAHYISVK